MYSLQLNDGTVISNLERLNPSTFARDGVDNNIYFALSDHNLLFAFLYNANDKELPDKIYYHYTLQNYVVMGNRIQFRLASIDELEQAGLHRQQKKRKKKI